jgi:hypothetical protein
VRLKKISKNSVTPGAINHHQQNMISQNKLGLPDSVKLRSALRTWSNASTVPLCVIRDAVKMTD